MSTSTVNTDLTTRTSKDGMRFHSAGREHWIDPPWEWEERDNPRFWIDRLQDSLDALPATAKLPALTICQPYASMIASGTKVCENRHWRSLALKPGPFLIHAGKSLKYMLPGYLKRWPLTPLGKIIAVAWYDGAYYSDVLKSGRMDSRYPGIAHHEHVEGNHCWIFPAVIELPIAVVWKGEQQIFEVAWDDVKTRGGVE